MTSDVRQALTGAVYEKQHWKVRIAGALYGFALSGEEEYFVAIVLIGIGATLLMDLWNLFLKRFFGVPSLNYCLLGRWISHMPNGTFRHPNIGAAPPKRFECATGWIAHYTIGVAFACVFILFASREWLMRPSVFPALIFGIGTVVLPFFIMQPSLGLGIASSRTPRPMQARLKSVLTHTIFGIGLYASGVAVSHMLRANA